jgi:hypothetical protein
MGGDISVLDPRRLLSDFPCDLEWEISVKIYEAIRTWRALLNTPWYPNFPRELREVACCMAWWVGLDLPTVSSHSAFLLM